MASPKYEISEYQISEHQIEKYQIEYQIELILA